GVARHSKRRNGALRGRSSRVANVGHRKKRQKFAIRLYFSRSPLCRSQGLCSRARISEFGESSRARRRGDRGAPPQLPFARRGGCARVLPRSHTGRCGSEFLPPRWPSCRQKQRCSVNPPGRASFFLCDARVGGNDSAAWNRKGCVFEKL